MIRVVLVDDHQLLRTGLASLLEAADDVTVVGEAGDGEQALAVLAEVPDVDVVLMDLSMPVLDGVAATGRVRAEYPEVRVVVLSSFAEHMRVRDAVSAGAVGYVLKDSTPDELIAAIRAAAGGNAPLDPRVAGALLPGTSEPASLLSARETEVLQLAAQGLPNKQIARSLGIAERTVKVHLGNVFRSIGVRDRTSAALWAREHLGDHAGRGTARG